MESDNEKPVDLNFYGLPVHGSSMFTIDLYSNPVADIRFVENQLNLLSRKTLNCNLQYTLFHPAIPITEPSCIINTLCNEDLVSFKKIYKDGIAKWKLKPKASKQVRWFQDNYQKYVHESLRNFDKDDALDNENHIFPLVVGYSKVIASSRTAKSFSDFIPEVYDIPEHLLIELLEHSMFQEYDTLNDNFSLKNCIASWRCSERVYIFFPKGLDFSMLSVSIAVHNNLGSKYKEVSEFKYVNLNTVLEVEMSFEIKEILVEQNFLFIRGNYQFVQFTLESLFDNQKLIEIRRFQFDTFVLSAAVNPLIPDEIFVTTPNSVSLISGVDTKKLSEFPLAPELEMSWHSCIPGSFRQTCIVTSPEEVRMYDFRMSFPSSKIFFIVPCQYLNRTEKFSPVLLWNPINKYQFFVTTDQSVMLLDERYVKTPVLKTNHYMKSPPRFGQAISREIFSPSDSILINVASYLSAENICMQFCSNGKQDVLIGDSSLRANCPLTLLNEPWKFSCYNEWLPYTSHWKLSNNSLMARMTQPLIGTCICSLEENYKNDELIYVQLTLSGDLFYQSFNCKNSNRENDGVEKALVKRKLLYSLVDENVMQLNNISNEICQTWLDKCPIDGIKFSKTTSCISENQSVVTDKHSQESDIGSSVVSEAFNALLPQDSTLNSFNFLKSIRNENKILTNRSLKRQSNDQYMTIIDNPETFNYPLSRSLYTNWINDYYTPLDVFAPNLALDKSLNFV